jgi:hypothetical protein
MAETDDAVATFLRDAEKVYSEYENGYMDADAALSLLETHIGNLREETESEA